jgi:ribonuclease T2
MREMRQFVRFGVLAAAAAGGLMAQFHLPGNTPGSSTKPATPPAPAKPPAATAPATPHKADHYVLSLSAQPGRIHVDGFRAESNDGLKLESCEAVKPASRAAIRIAQSLMASQPAMQKEWATDGSCTGYTAVEYFNALRFARSLVQIPVQLTSPDDEAPRQTLKLIETQYASANPGFPAGAFRAAASEVEVCFDLQLRPQACSVTGSN